MHIWREYPLRIFDLYEMLHLFRSVLYTPVQYLLVNKQNQSIYFHIYTEFISK